MSQRPAPARTSSTASGGRRPRADARRNLDALVEAAKTVFARSGVDAPAKEITDLAGVGVGTLYRHFPRRATLVAAVLQHEIDACADAAPTLLAGHDPVVALERWVHRYTEFVGTKRGLAEAMHSGDPAYSGLHAYFLERLEPALADILTSATAVGGVREDTSARDVLHAVALLCQAVPGEDDFAYNQRLVTVFIDGLRMPPRP
ncbi:TetR/AcrR family transcriptional regulator [Streptomyces tendae]|uniref:TetR/AcrR family transcriptional regulator n=1 Tax=Streptomyces tendae TaxID=1932 RepID=UPI003680B78E